MRGESQSVKLLQSQNYLTQHRNLGYPRMAAEPVPNHHQLHPPRACSAPQSVRIKTKERSFRKRITSQRLGERSPLRRTLTDSRQASGDAGEQENGKAIIRSEPQMVKSRRDQRDVSRKTRTTTPEDCWAIRELQSSSVKKKH